MNKLEHRLFNDLIPFTGLNRRRFFNPVEGEKLRNSIREHSVQQPLLIAEGEDGGPGRIIAGERRWRETCSLLEQLKQEIIDAEDPEQVRKLRALVEDRMQLPVSIIPDDKVPAALALNMVENLCRADITALEEAEGYQEMSRTMNPETGVNYTIEEIAIAVSETSSYIRRRLKLANAPAFFLEAVNRGDVAATIAEIVGRIPGVKAREEAAKHILEPDDQEIPLNFAQAKAWIQENCMISLNKCGFDTEEEELVPVETIGEPAVRIAGGSCGDCPMRSGMNPELQSELSRQSNEEGKGNTKGRSAGIDPNLCTNPDCFRRKQDASWAIVRRLAEGKGQKIVDGDVARKVFGGYQGQVAYDSAYAPIDDSPTGSEVNWTSGLPKWEKLIKGTTAEVVVGRNPFTHQIVLMVEKKPAIEAIRKKAKADGVPTPWDADMQRGSSGSGGAKKGPKMTEEQERAKLERERAAAVEKKAIALIYDEIDGKVCATSLEDAEMATTMVMELVRFLLDYGQMPTLIIMDRLGLERYASSETVAAAFKKQLEADLTGDSRAAQNWMSRIIAGIVLEGTDWDKNVGNDPDVQHFTIALGVNVPRCYELAEQSVPAVATEGAPIENAPAPLDISDEAKEESCGGAENAEGGIHDDDENSTEKAISVVQEQLKATQAGIGGPAAYYHCDECHTVCIVPGIEVDEVESMADGDFKCEECQSPPWLRYEAVPSEMQSEFVPWPLVGKKKK